MSGYDTPFELKVNTGTFFKNKRKEKDTDPSVTGSINAEGTLFWVNIWTAETKAGEKYWKASLKLKEEAAPAKPKGRAPGEDADEEIPF